MFNLFKEKLCPVVYNGRKCNAPMVRRGIWWVCSKYPEAMRLLRWEI